VPSYRTSFYWRGRQYTRLRALFPGYVFAYLGDGWGMLNEIEGVRPVYRAGRLSRCSGADAERLAQLEKHCLLGDFNRAQIRNAPEKLRKRRRRPRHGKRVSNRTDTPNQMAA
jgi:hypothetical protein